tara:strand:- start:325 stop:2442 length:2118 start_codon:yes stop_codon:yes gene_type:complete
MATTFYYPEGPTGPVCDLPGEEERRLVVGDDEVDPRQDTYGPIDWGNMEQVMDGPVQAIRTRRCRVRELADGRKEYYDCVDELLSPIANPPEYPLIEPQYDWKGQSTQPWGLDDDFEPIKLDAKSCSPHDPDINIFPVKFYKANGTFVQKTLVEKSSPVTFPVNSGSSQVVGEVGASFVLNGNTIQLNVTGSGTVNLEFSWDDNPSTAGTALSALSVGGVTFNQTGRKGKTSSSLTVNSGDSFNVTINPGTGYGGQSVSSSSICFYDLDGTDCNATLRITSAVTVAVANDTGYWSAEGNTYAVWVNPEVCTLPRQTQQVTYLIPISVTDTYTITGGADDEFEVFLNDSTNAIIGGAGGIFAGGSLTTPYSATTTLQAGTLKMVVRCTNSDAGFNTDGQPSGLAYSWNRNPGGWYVKICRGTSCIAPTSSTWVPSGPNGDGAWTEWMDKYATFASNFDTLPGELQTNTWTINVPFPGTYELDYGFDDVGTLSLDGTEIISSTYNGNTAPATYTISNLSAGPHTLTATCTNQNGDDWIANPAGVGWTLTPLDTASDVSVGFDSSGNIVTTGEGTAEVEFLFEWDDNPNTAGQALGTVTWDGVSGLEFTQTQGVSSGSDDDTVTLEGGKTYNLQVFNSTGGFEVQNNGQKICFFDNDGKDCNAEVRVGTVNQGGGGIISSSLDLSANDVSGNLIWHTRMATGYEYVEV